MLFKLKGFIILKSSENRYHVVLDRKVSWSENVRITSWVCLRSRSGSLAKYSSMQYVKQGSTLRVSPKRNKPCPRIVFRYGALSEQVKGFLDFRMAVKAIMKQAVFSKSL